MMNHDHFEKRHASDDPHGPTSKHADCTKLCQLGEHEERARQDFLKGKTKPVCPICGSADAVTMMTWASWDIDTQQWELTSTDDTGDCNLCGANDVTLEFIDADTPTAEIDLAEDQETVNRLAKAAWEAKWIGVTDAIDSKSPMRR
jgi:RNA polymerase subunit RPABC4/transcription elongation factor Spt4